MLAREELPSPLPPPTPLLPKLPMREKAEAAAVLAVEVTDPATAPSISVTHTPPPTEQLVESAQSRSPSGHTARTSSVRVADAEYPRLFWTLYVMVYVPGVAVLKLHASGRGMSCWSGLVVCRGTPHARTYRSRLPSNESYASAPGSHGSSRGVMGLHLSYTPYWFT